MSTRPATKATPHHLGAGRVYTGAVVQVDHRPSLSALSLNPHRLCCRPKGSSTAFPTRETERWEEEEDVKGKRGHEGGQRTRTVEHERVKHLTREEIEGGDRCEICLESPNVLPETRNPTLSEPAKALIEASKYEKWGVFCTNGHAFHWVCIAGLLRTGAECPNCRQPPLPSLRQTLGGLADRIHVSVPAGIPVNPTVVQEIRDAFDAWSTTAAAEEGVQYDHPDHDRPWWESVWQEIDDSDDDDPAREEAQRHRRAERAQREARERQAARERRGTRDGD
jgi:hypothetical protein